MRPVGEIRQALEQALRATGAATSRALAASACVGLTAAQRTLDNMARGGHVVKGRTRVPGVRRPVPVYALASRAQEQGA